MTHRMEEDLKEALDEFCEQHGLKQQAVMSEALASWLEDAEDLALIESRREGPFERWADVRDKI